MTKNKKKIYSLILLLPVILIVSLSLWGPEALAGYRDKGILDKPHVLQAEEAGEGYRYILSSNEKIYIVSQCLNSQTLPESDYNAMTRNSNTDLDYQERAGSYSFVMNYKGPSGQEITDEEIYENCNSGLSLLKELGILPDSVRNVTSSSYSAVLYSAIDVLEPRNNVPIWKISLSTAQQNANKENRLIDAYISAVDGNIYEFYVRTEWEWEDIDADEMIARWSEYMGLNEPVPYESDNLLSETTPYYKKYVFTGIGKDSTVVTIGFYDGINELFLKISK